MAKFNTIRNNFLFGEVSPQVFSRVDVDNFFRSCEEIRNALCYPQGGAGRRPGSLFVDDSLSAETGVRLVPYVLSTTRAYMIAFKANSTTVKIYDVAAPSTSITVDYYGLPQYTADELKELQFSQYGTILLAVHANHPPIAVQAASNTAFEITGICAHGGAPTDTTIFPRSLSARFLIVNKALSDRFPLQSVNVDPDHLLAPSATTGVITLLSQNAALAPVPFFNPAMVQTADLAPTIFRIQGSLVKVVSFVSSSEVTAEVVGAALAAATATATWTEGAWGPYRGWPRTVTYFEDRAIFGGNATFPDTLFGTQIGDIFELDATLGTGNSFAFSAAIRSEKLDGLQWLNPGNTLNTGSLSKEYIVSGLSESQTLGQSNTKVRPQTQHGSAYVQSIRVDSAPLFVTRTARRIREFVFNFDEDAYRSADIMQYAEHIVNRARDLRATPISPKLVNLQYAEGEFPLVWMIDNNGGLLSLTRDRSQSVAAFTYHVMGGSLSGEAPRVESIAAVPSNTGTHDELWMIVSRTINGATVRYVERFVNTFRGASMSNASTSVYDKPIFCDSAAFQIAGAPMLAFGGWSHLIGQTVDVIADGTYVGQKVVDSTGTITLDVVATEVIAGLPYRSLVKPTSIEAGSQLQASVGTVKRIDRLVFKFTNTIGVKYGMNENSLDNINFRNPLLPLNQPIPLFTGDKEVLLDSGFDIDLRPIVVQDLPLPFFLNSVVYEGITYD